MNKRALLLTAATVALLSGRALADTTIDSKTTDALKTSTSGNITIKDGTGSSVGSVEIPSSSTVSTIPAIEIDSSSTVTIADTDNTVSYKDTSSAVGIKLDAAGYTSEFINGGTVDLSGSGTDKIGIDIAGTGTITGSTNDPNTDITYLDGVATVVDLEGGSTVKVEGDGSYGIQVASTATVDGQIYIAGTVQATASSTSAVYGVSMQGTMNGNFVIDSGGLVEAIGTGAEGVVIFGQLNGSFINSGEIETVGTSKLKTGASNPEGGAGLTIENSISGGVYNAGSFGSTVTGTGSIIVEGNAPAVSISASSTFGPVTIGAVSNPDLLGSEGAMSFINRGIIESTPESPYASVAGFVVSGTDTTNQVKFSAGFSNTGTIEALGNSTAAATGSTLGVQITALNIENFVTLSPGGAVNTAFYNGDETPSSTGTGFTPAEIVAEYSGNNVSGTAIAIDIGTGTGNGTSVPSLDNAGVIQATASSTDKSITSLAAFGIIDNSGTLLNILNESTGVISAGASTLKNNEQVNRAIDLESAGGNTQITNHGRITGDVLLGSHTDTVTVSGISGSPATLNGSIYFGGNDGTNADVLTVGGYGTVNGTLLNNNGNYIEINVENAGTLNILNNGTMPFTYTVSSTTIPVGGQLPAGIAPGVNVTTLSVANGATLGLTVAQPFNENNAANDGPLVSSQGLISMNSGATLNINYGSFVSSTVGNPAKFVLLQAPTAADLDVNIGSLQASFGSKFPFLYSGTLDLENSGTSTGLNQLVLMLVQKPATGVGGIGLTGYAAKMYDIANAALVNDNILGSAIITAGAGVTDAAQGQAIYQKIYSQFAPDVTGSTRAIAISLTDSSSGPVAARQRALRMYANQDGDLTLWGQEFAQDLSVSSSTVGAGYRNTGFGFVVGADGGDPANGRYGGAFTFYSGNTSQRQSLLSRTDSEWYMFTGYSDWRGKRMFFDSQISVGYASLKGTRKINVYSDDDTPLLLASRTATNSHAAEFLAGSISTGFILHSGGTSLTPQIDVDGLTMRQEAYAESNGNVTTRPDDGFDLAVASNYASSVRGFAGLDLRQDLRFSSFYFQPEIRAGYRYDFLDGADKITANFLSEPLDKFTVEGPDPSRGNLVLGGGFAVTTGAWSLGLNYDYKRGIGGTGGTDQVGSLTLLGRI